MPEKQSLKSNVPEFSVSELAFSLKKTIEDNYSRVRVRGELSRVSIAASGHMYSSLKDDNAVIDVICWKGVMSKLSLTPEEGLEVVCVGRLSTYPVRSNYQLIVESIELAGEGALLKMLEARKKKLAAEGLFDSERKSELPFLPQVIGVITSPTGSVIRDILHRLEDRFPRRVFVWPALVQGEGAAAQIAAGIDGFQNIDQQGFARPDLLIVARGGGSLEDLMPFNEEVVVRAVANSTIPVISAVGHETDTTLIDYVADLRAPTPTGAAEMAVPVRANLIAQIAESEARLVSAAMRHVSECKNILQSMGSRLGTPIRLLESHTQKLDYLSDTISRVFDQYVGVKHQSLLLYVGRLRDPKIRLEEAQQSLTRWSEQLLARGPKVTFDLEKQIEHLGKMLKAYSFENILSRGFAVVQSDKGEVIRQAEQTKDGQALHIRLQDNQFLDAVVGKVDGVKPQKKHISAKKVKKNKDTKQQSLF